MSDKRIISPISFSEFTPEDKEDPNTRNNIWCVEVICANNLALDCVVRSLNLSSISSCVNGYLSVSEWRQSRKGECLVVLCGWGSEETNRIIEHDLAEILNSEPAAKVVIISDMEQPHQIGRSLEMGARGFIGMSSTFEIVLAAFRLVWAGGRFMPVSSLGSAIPMLSDSKINIVRGEILTPREIEIIKCIRRGERNKTISMNLNIKESTVGVHIRNIMQKLGARNRVELSFMAKEMLV